MIQKRVLIVGAGPSGLTLALELAYSDVPFTLIDKGEGPGETSRAMLVVPRVLESYRKFGLDRAVKEQGIIPQYAHFHVNNKRVASLPLGIMGRGQSLYPYLVTFPQDEHEEMLIDKLKAFGVDIKWNTELVVLDQGDDETFVTLRRNGETHVEPFNYIIGCDGASSQVRKQSGIDFEGSTYEQVFYVVDAKADGNVIEKDAGSFSFVKNYFALFFPLRNKDTTRLIGMFPPELTKKQDLSYESLKPVIEEAFDVTLSELNWFSSYRIHRRAAASFKSGNHFLVGDAAHIHSPVGGQGMNLGIGDAFNLGWKLSQVVKGQAPERLLDTYESERKQIAELLLATTDQLFSLIAGSTRSSLFTRQFIIPVISKAADALQPFQDRLYTVLSQLYISYEKSLLSTGNFGKLRAGKRLPYVDSEVFEYVREAGWQLHRFEPADDQIQQLCEKNGIDQVDRRWTDKARDKGFTKETLLLVRPDGYIGWIGKEADKAELIVYVTEWFIPKK